MMRTLMAALLAERRIRHVGMDKDLPVGKQAFFAEHDQCVRDVRMGPAVALCVRSDEEQGALLRVVPG